MHDVSLVLVPNRAPSTPRDGAAPHWAKVSRRNVAATSTRNAIQVTQGLCLVISISSVEKRRYDVGFVHDLTIKVRDQGFNAATHGSPLISKDNQALQMIYKR
ncbi:hypothetical protein J6590_000523 [Homalodisca vitripennis]|nr:hypothetical protein J6590_000523 [Homalodisca vitripennis]